jgi:hypothetical protein
VSTESAIVPGIRLGYYSAAKEECLFFIDGQFSHPLFCCRFHIVVYVAYPGEDHHGIIVAEGLDDEAASVNSKNQDQHSEAAEEDKYRLATFFNVKYVVFGFVCLPRLRPCFR